MTLLFTEFDKDMDGVTVEEIPKAGRGASDSNEVGFEDARVPADDIIGEEGCGFKYLLSFANAERVNVAANCIGVRLAALDKASAYANEREVFGNAIGSYQGIQHPLRGVLDETEDRRGADVGGAWLVDEGEQPGAEANTVKLRASEDALEA